MHKKHSQESPVFSKVNLQRYRSPWLFCSCLPVKFSKFQRILDLEREKKIKIESNTDVLPEIFRDISEQLGTITSTLIFINSCGLLDKFPFLRENF